VRPPIGPVVVLILTAAPPKEIATKLVLDASAAQPAPFSDDHERRPVIGRTAFVDRHQNGVSEGFGPRQFWAGGERSESPRCEVHSGLRIHGPMRD